MQRLSTHLSHLAAGFGLLIASALACAGTSVGVISYWGSQPQSYDQLPNGAVALINPDSGIFVSAGQTTTLAPDLALYKDIVKKAAKRDIAMLGYVPTGYFNHTCNQPGRCQTWDRIEAQVKAYFKNVPKLEGIFFDEAAPSDWQCGAFPAEYQRLRDIVYKYDGKATIAFNAGVPDDCAVAGAEAGDILVLFESSQSDYARYADAVRISTLHALDKGVTTWHLVHTVRTAADMAAVVTTAKSTHVDLFYSTDVDGDWQAGHNTWGALPPYWQQEVALLDGSSETLPTCAALAAGPLDAGVIKTDWADIGKPGNIYIGARGADGKSWMHDGLQWQHYLGATRDVFRPESLRGLVRLTNQDVARLLAGVPGTASIIWVGYALAEEPDELRSRSRLCTLR